MSDEQLVTHLKACIARLEAHVDAEAQRLRDDRRAATLALREAGWSLERIAAAVGRRKQTITQWLREGNRQ